MRELNPEIRSSHDLHHAIKGGELALYYQPIVNLIDETVTGFEALVRWHHPYLGTLCAAEFVPLAEPTGLIHDLDAWVLESACVQLAAWQEHALVGRRFRVAIKLSGGELDGDWLVERVRRVIGATGADPRALVIEVTETCDIPSVAAARRSIDGLHALGIEVGLDDVGSHDADFTRLHALPFDILKIDRSVVVESGAERGRAIVRSLIELGGLLQARVIAEGIETRAQALLFRSLGCREGQGFYWAPALSAAQAEQLLALGVWPAPNLTPAWSAPMLAAA